jgi:acetyltransferase-like isoleucine patch superfamily enzyme
MKISGINNSVRYGDNVMLSGSITGNDNLVEVGSARVGSEIRITIHGNNNRIVIADFYQIKSLAIQCGNHVPAHGTSVSIGGRFSIEPSSVFLMYNSENRLVIGDDCLFSSNITIRCGESPHLIFDLQTGEYLDVSEGVFIGNHVWVGEKVYITKRVTIPDECIVAACSVVTRRFENRHAVIGGNPAQIVKSNVRWIRNSDFLEEGSIYQRRFQEDRDNLPGTGAQRRTEGDA